MLSDKFEEFAKTLFIIDKPMSRWPYFKICLCLFILGLLVYGIVMFLVSLIEATSPKEIASILYILFFGFAAVWVLFNIIISFVLMTKRFWDIIGNKNYAIIGTILFFATCVLSKIIAPIKVIKLIIALVLFLAKGKNKENIINKDIEEKQISEEG